MNENQHDQEGRLFCKPSHESISNDLIYTTYNQSIQSLVSLRYLDLDTDLDMIYEWVNRSYSKRFWQLNGSRELVKNTYRKIIENPRAHSFIGIINQHPVCQIDAYLICGDELEVHVESTDQDAGLHLLMAPPRELKKGWSLAALQIFQDYFFSFPKAERLYAEPDHENIPANTLSVRAGFQFLEELQMSYKTANLYCLSRSHYRILRSSPQTNG
jgi:RimJ/RimL family protein N-acetyltransferase